MYERKWEKMNSFFEKMKTDIVNTQFCAYPNKVNRTLPYVIAWRLRGIKISKGLIATLSHQPLNSLDMINMYKGEMILYTDCVNPIFSHTIWQVCPL